MNKERLAEAVGERVGLTKQEMEKIINAVIAVIEEQMKAGNEVTLSSFGSFTVQSRAARAGVNPQRPSERIQIPAVKVPKFKAGKGLKEAVRS